jgi:hypothetical protein
MMAASPDIVPSCPLHSGIKVELIEHERRLNQVDDTVEDLYAAVNALRGRPSWFVCGIISALSAMTGTFATLYFTQLQHHAMAAASAVLHGILGT